MFTPPQVASFTRSKKDPAMKHAKPYLLGVALVLLSLAGCGEKSGTKTETTVTTPGGSTTTTVEKEVKTTGENPPSK